MKRIKITSKGKVKCPRTSEFVNYGKCVDCEDGFGVITYCYVNCKRGLKKDDIIKKTENVVR